jgi:hypothetical protein
MPQADPPGGRPACAHCDYDSHAAITAVTTVRIVIAPWISIVSSPPAMPTVGQTAVPPSQRGAARREFASEQRRTRAMACQ